MGSDAALDAFLASGGEDALGFAGAKMAQRTLGLARVEDLERVEPPALRAACEERTLHLARALVVGRAAIGTVAEARARARRISGERS